MKNLIGIWPNLSRAYEIARMGNFTLSVIYDKEYKNGQEDYKLIKAFYPEVVFTRKGDITMEILEPIWERVSNRERGWETLADIEKRVRQGMRNETPVWARNEANEQLKHMAVERLHLSVKDLETINNMATSIAQIEGVKFVQPHHVAEAINYKAIDHNHPYVWAEDSTHYFGNGISISDWADKYEIEQAIEYLKTML
jgi:hypothetical protein